MLCLKLSAAGNDNGLCTAPMAGAEDESFVHAVLDWIGQTRGGWGKPTFLYGHSGGGRMSWRTACNSTLGRRLSGVFVTSALLPAALRNDGASATCSLSTMPSLIVTHGTSDKTTDISFEDESVAWLAAAAECSTTTTTAGVGKDPVAELIYHTNCPGVARPGFTLAYYRLQDAPHKVPKAFWYGAALDFWMRGVGPGMEGYDATQPSAGSRSALCHYPVLMFATSICALLGAFGSRRVTMLVASVRTSAFMASAALVGPLLWGCFY